MAERLSEVEYLARIEALARAVAEAASDEGTYALYGGEEPADPLERAIHSLAAQVRHIHFLADGCIEDAKVVSLGDLYESAGGLSELLWRNGQKSLATQLYLSMSGATAGEILPQLRESLRSVRSDLEIVRELDLEAVLHTLLTYIDEALDQPLG